MGFVMATFYLVNWPDEDIRQISLEVKLSDRLDEYLWKNVMRVLFSPGDCFADFSLPAEHEMKLLRWARPISREKEKERSP